MIELRGKYASCKIFNDEVEEAAITQVYTFLNHPAFEGCNIRIMPDIHYGAGVCIGFTSTYNSKIIPHVIGVDIGCGVCCYYLGRDKNIDFQALDTYIRKNIPFGCSTRQKTAKREIMNYAYSVCKERDKSFPALSGEFLDDVREVASRTGQDEQYVINSLGTLGGGNHYIEIDVNDITGDKYLNIHSGSRNFGLKIANIHQKIAKQEHSFGDLSYLEGDSCACYLEDMMVATKYAALNREIMATYILQEFFGIMLTKKYESVHNYIDFQDGIIRKGAISAKKNEDVVIPWNMRDGVIIGVGKGNIDWNNSAPHGAGRIMGRNVAKKTLDLEEYQAEMSGIWSSCINAGTIDESPMAYKDHTVIKALLADTVDVVAQLKPIYNFKATE